MNGTVDRSFSEDDFVQGIYDNVFRAAVEDTVSIMARPPGRAPRPERLELSRWWAGLGSDDRDMVRRALTLTADLAVFGFLCVLDNVRTIADSCDLELRLHAELAGEDYPIPADEATELHDLFQALVRGYPESGLS